MKQCSVVRGAKPTGGQRATERLHGWAWTGQPALMFSLRPSHPISKSLSHDQSPRGLLEQAVSILTFELNCLTHMPTNRSPTHPIHSLLRVAGLTYPATPLQLQNAKAAEGMLNAIWQCGARYWSNKWEPKLEKSNENNRAQHFRKIMTTAATGARGTDINSQRRREMGWLSR